MNYQLVTELPWRRAWPSISSSVWLTCIPWAPSALPQVPSCPSTEVSLLCLVPGAAAGSTRAFSQGLSLTRRFPWSTAFPAPLPEPFNLMECSLVSFKAFLPSVLAEELLEMCLHQMSWVRRWCWSRLSCRGGGYPFPAQREQGGSAAVGV